MKPQSRNFSFVAGGICILIGTAALVVMRMAHRTIRLTAPEIQAQLTPKFPQEKRDGLFITKYSDPTVAIDSQSGRVTLGVSISFYAVTLRAVSGRAEAEGALRYEPSSGELFLDSPTTRVKNFDLVGLPEKYQGIASGLVEKGIQQYLAKTPLYRIGDRDAKLFSARRTLKSIHVKDGTIIVELGM